MPVDRLPSPLLAAAERLSRREFVEAGTLMALAVAISACGGGPSGGDPTGPGAEPPAESAGAGGAAPLPAGVTLVGLRLRIALATQPALRVAGGLLTINRTVPQPLNVVLVGLGEGAVAALSSVCTHSGCADRWGAESGTLVCGCHGSTFDVGGRVLRGPAADALRAYPVRRLDGEDAVEVTLS